MSTPQNEPTHTDDEIVELAQNNIHKSFMQLRIDQNNVSRGQRVPRQRRVSTAYGAVPNDLERITSAAKENEVLEVVNEVLQVLQRCGWMIEVPQELRMEKLANVQEIRIAMKTLQSDIPCTEQVQWKSDSLCVLRAVFSAAEERVGQLRQREMHSRSQWTCG